MSRPAQVRFCERQRGKFLLPTRLVIHCTSKQQAELMMEKLKEQMKLYELELHPEKTRIVYCKDYRRKDNHDNTSFTFLGFNYQPANIKSKRDGMFLGFKPIISLIAQKHIRSEIRKVIVPRWSNATVEMYADKLNNKVRGWINYYGVIEKRKVRGVIEYANYLLIKWIQNKYRVYRKHAISKMKLMQKEQPELFYHWKIGITF